MTSLDARQAYLDGELCGVGPDGITFLQHDPGRRRTPATRPGSCSFLFDLLHLDGEDVAARPLIERKARLAELLSGVAPPLHYSDHQHRPAARPFTSKACELERRGHRLETRRCALRARQPRALHVIQHTDRNLSSSHTRGTRFTANAFASTAASDVPAVRSFTSRCSQVFPEKFQHGCAMLRCAQRYRRGQPGLRSRP